MSSGIGVERTFPLYSPTVTKIDVVRRGSVRRSRLYYLRQLTGKSARIKEKVRGMNYVARPRATRRVLRGGAATPRSGGVDAAERWRRRRGAVASTPRSGQGDAAGRSGRRRGAVRATPRGGRGDAAGRSRRRRGAVAATPRGGPRRRRGAVASTRVRRADAIGQRSRIM